MNRAVFLDRDGTINVDGGYVHRVEDFIYLPNAKRGMRSMLELGYELVVVTNQSGIARGLFSEEDFRSLTDWMVSDLEASGIRISGVYHCPHHEEFTGPCGCRKPAPGLYLRAAEDLGLELGSCWMVGDSPRDVGACAALGCRGILLGAQSAEGNIYQAGDLLEAARIIEREGTSCPS